MRHSGDPYELLEVLGDELRTIVRDDPGRRVWALLLRPLQDDLDGRLGHRLPDVPVHDVPAETVQDAAQVVERTADVEVGNINVPVLMCCQRLREARALLRRLPVPLRQESGLAEHSPHAGRADRRDVGIQHHEHQPPVAFQRVLQVEPDDGLFPPILQPEIAGNPAVVLVNLPVAFPPVVELAGGDVEPHDELAGADLGLL